MTQAVDMDPRIPYVDEILGFMFQEGFARQFEQLGSPQGDLEVWFRNAKVYEAVTGDRPIPAAQRVRLVTLVEAIRFEAMCGALPGESMAFDVSVYEFSEDILAYKQQIIDEVVQQEQASPSTIDPPPSLGGQVH